jgi:hypothetical protein
MGIYTYHLADVVETDRGRVGLLAFTGSAAFPFWAADIRRQIKRARRLSTATLRARTCNAPVALDAFASEWRAERTGGPPAPLYRWRYRRLSYTDGGRALRPA